MARIRSIHSPICSSSSFVTSSPRNTARSNPSLLVRGGEREREISMMLPLLKLGSLAFRTLCKPIASRIKHQASVHPKFRHFIINVAQANHRWTTRMSRSLYGQSTSAVIRPLNEERAVQAVADLLGELFMFSVAGTAIIFEVQRNARSEAKKEESRKQLIQAMKRREEDLAKEIELLKKRYDAIEQLLTKKPCLARIPDFVNHQTPKTGLPKATA